MDRYVVFCQETDESNRVTEVWGPFTSYENASAFAKHMNAKNNNQENTLWFGIRILQKTQIHKM